MSEIFRTVPRPNGDPNFKPVVIVLKTRNEAKFFWALAKFASRLVTSSSTFNDECIRLGLAPETRTSVCDELYPQLTSEYDPREEEEQPNEPDIPF